MPASRSARVRRRPHDLGLPTSLGRVSLTSYCPASADSGGPSTSPGTGSFSALPVISESPDFSVVALYGRRSPRPGLVERRFVHHFIATLVRARTQSGLPAAAIEWSGHV